MSADRRNATTSIPPLTSRRTHLFSSGKRLANRYRIDRLLGRGGMGDVYEALDEELSIPVAIKALRSDVGQTRDALWRLKREVLLARAVWHPHVCRIYDLGLHDEGEGATWFLTMELLDGETLRDRLLHQGPFNTGDALPLVEQMAAGLGAAHRAGVVHRDFKPGNVMLVRDPRGDWVVVTDFGLARPVATPADENDDSDAGVVMGTPAYLAPERIQGVEALPAADIYALGVVLYQMVTGSLPFAAPTEEEALHRRLVQDASSPRQLVQDLDERWEAVILRCLSREPGDRFARAEEVAEALAGRAPVVAVGALRRGVRARSTLPAERDAFVGRVAELEELAACIAGGARVVALLGAAGMGKTRLAVHFGWQNLDHWPGGVWFCDLTEAKEKNGIAVSVAGALGVPLGRGDAVEQLGYAIAGRGRCLVILDNAEQVVEQVQESLGRWLDHSEQAAFLVTSRERLDLRGQAVCVVEPLASESGVQLFIERASRQRPGLRPKDGDQELIRQIVADVGGMPLAIELAAARMRLMTVQELATRMRQGFGVLAAKGRGRHTTLRTAIDGSWDVLRPWEKAAWAQCAVFEGGFTLEAAEGILDLGAWAEAPWVIDVVQSLVDKSLIRTWVPEGPTDASVPEARFGMYVSLQEYAREKLREEGSIPAGGSGPQAERLVEERHSAWFAQYGTSDSIQALHHHGGTPRWWRLQHDLENLMAGYRRAVARGNGKNATSLYCAWYEIVQLQGPYYAAVESGRELIETALSRSDLGRALCALGDVERLLGHTDSSLSHLAEALAIEREVGNRGEEGRVLNALAKVYHEQGRMVESELHCMMALAIFRETGMRHLESVALGNLAGLHHELGRMRESSAEFEAALAIVREVGDRRLEGIVLGNLGVHHSDRGRLEEASNYYDAAIAITREVGDRRAEGVFLGNVGTLRLDQGRIEEAVAYYQAALTIRREVGDRRSMGMALANLGSANLEQDRLEEARAYFESALAVFREVQDRRCEGAALGNLARIHLDQGRIEESGAALARGEMLLREVGDPHEIGKLLCVRSEFEGRKGDTAGARATLDEVEAFAQRVGTGSDSDLGRSLARLRQRLSSLGVSVE